MERIGAKAPEMRIFMENQSKTMAKLAYQALEEKKAEDIKVIEIGEISVIADYFIIGHGNNTSQVEAITEEVEKTLEKNGFSVKRVEGAKNSGWILMDYGDIVVHVFVKEDRLFYDLERIWRDGKTIEKEELE